ncbi:UNKNOWN [Stylonychia lemnae]|uniref:Uncharacterized protein n=1 Tax=Stylonychia lemnae TaxID=5949 RepID=A0A078AAP3_STYLE|nr:UNKNOWN [Stylonychia lemnae]|eukprot:CDW78657.1 UNKNOWN [Stylonychia lemnae]
MEILQKKQNFSQQMPMDSDQLLHQIFQIGMQLILVSIQITYKKMVRDLLGVPYLQIQKNKSTSRYLHQQLNTGITQSFKEQQIKTIGLNHLLLPTLKTMTNSRL